VVQGNACHPNPASSTDIRRPAALALGTMVGRVGSLGVQPGQPDAYPPQPRPTSNHPRYYPHSRCHYPSAGASSPDCASAGGAVCAWVILRQPTLY
jgi:hypothetical protein